MKKEMTILYKVHNNLYVNLTNRCPCACTFCLRQTKDNVTGDDSSLWLSHEPSVQEVIDEFEKFDVEAFDEIVFCGFGEPTERLDTMLEVAAYIKKQFGKPIRVNTNGLANLIWEENVTPKLAGLVDTISVSLNTPDAKRYQEIVCSKFGEQSFEAMLTFAKDAKKYVKNVILSTVSTTLTEEEEKRCQEICDTLGVTYRIRLFE